MKRSHSPFSDRYDASSDTDDQVTKNAELFCAIRKKENISEEARCKELERYLNEGADINAVDKNDHSNTILHIAVKKNYTYIVKFLVKRSAKVNIANAEGKTPLTFAQDHYKNLERILGKSDSMSLIQSTKNIVDSEISINENICEREESSHGLSKANIIESEISINENICDREESSHKLNKANIIESESCKSSPYVELKSLHSSIYELKLLMLYLQRGLENGYKFCLGTEIESVERLEGILFQSERKDHSGNAAKDDQQCNSYEYRLLQAKHKKYNYKQIDYRDLSSENIEDEFSLQRYFINFRKINQKLKFQKGGLKDLIISTNVNLDFEDLKKINIRVVEVTEQDDFLDMKIGDKMGIRYKLLIDDEHEIYQKLKNTSVLHMLANTLVGQIRDQKDVNLTSILKFYYAVLVQEQVIEIKETEQGGRKEYIGTFNEKFINFNISEQNNEYGLSESAQKLHKIIQEKLKMEGLSVERFTELKLSNNFVKGIKVYLDPGLTKVKKLAEKFVSLLKKAKTGESCIIKRDKGIISSNIEKLIEYILVEKDNKIQFSSTFLNVNRNLSGNLEEFRKELIHKLDKEQIDFHALDQYQFKIEDLKGFEKELLRREFALPMDIIDDMEIADFFDKLIFVINQLNEIEFEEVVKAEIGEAFSLIDTETFTDDVHYNILKWWQEKNTEVTKLGYFFITDGHDLLASTKEKMIRLKVDKSTSKFRAKISRLGIKFSQESLNELKLGDFCIGKKEAQIFCLITEHIKLSTVKLFQILHTLPGYQTDDSYIFIRLNSLLYMQRHVIKYFKLQNCNLLVIKCDDVPSKNDISLLRLCRHLSKIINAEISTSKKIIIIAKQGDIFSNLLKRKLKLASKYQETRDTLNGFANLTEESQKKLITENKIFLQGHEMSLDDIIYEASKESMDLIGSVMLDQLINGEKIKIGEELTISCGYNEDYYIDRSFNRQIEIQPMIFKIMLESLSDILAVSGFSKQILMRFGITNEESCNFHELDNHEHEGIRLVILNKQQIDKQFQELCTYYPKRNIHLLKEELGKIMWQQSRGSKFTLAQHKQALEEKDNTGENNLENKLLQQKNPQIRKYAHYYDNAKMYNDNISIMNFSEESVLLQNRQEHKVVIVADNAGMGKSTVLTSFAKRLKESSHWPIWVIRIDLTNLTVVLNDQNEKSFNNGDVDSAINFLIETLLESHKLTRLRSNFERNLLKNCFKFQSKIKVALLFDAFHDISPDYKEVISDLLQTLQKSHVELLIVAARPSMKLEERLGVLAYTLESFSEDNAVQFLTKFWTKKLDLRCRKEESRNGLLDVYSRAVIHKFYESISKKEREFTVVPLHLSMLAEVFLKRGEGTLEEWQGCKEFLTSNVNKKPMLPHKFELIDLHEHFLKKKILCDSNMHENQQLSVSKQHIIRISDIHYDELKIKYGLLAFSTLDLNELLNVEEIQERDRLIKGIETGEVNREIVYQIVNNKPNFVHLSFAEYFASFLIIEKMFPDFDKVLQIIDSMITNTSPTFINCIIKLLDAKLTNLEEVLDGKTLLNYVIQKGYLEFSRLLLEAGHVNYPKSDSLCKTPLHYAVEYEHTVIVEALLRYHNDRFENYVLEYDSFEHKAYTKSKLANFVNMKDKTGNTAVYYAAKNDNMTMVCELLLTGADRRSLKEYIRKVTLYVTDILHGHYFKYHKLRPVAEKLLLHYPCAASDFSESYEYPRLLSNFLIHGRYKVIKALMNSISDIKKRKKILNAPDNGTTPLSRVNTSNNHTDGERLQTLKCLVENGADMHSINEGGSQDYILWILRYCAIYGYTKTYNYFFNQKYLSEIYANFYAAARFHQFNVVKYIFKHYKQNIIDKGNTALHATVNSKARLSIIKYIIDNGNYINARNDKGETPLFQAVYSGRLNVIKLLVDHGADFNMTDFTSNTPLYYAIDGDHEEVVKYLVFECKAEVEITSQFIRNKFNFFKNPTDFNLNQVDYTGTPRLHRAIQSNDFKWTKFIIQNGANINSKDNEGRTPLHWAALHQQINIVELLLQYGAIYDATDKNNHTAFDLLTPSDCNLNYNYGVKKIIWLLNILYKLFHSQELMKDFKKWLLGGEWGPYLTGYPDPWDSKNPMLFMLNVRNTQMKTLLHVAAIMNDEEAINNLLSFNSCYLEIKADKNFLSSKDYQSLSIDAKDFQGNTALHLAAIKGYDNIVSSLLDKGAVHNIENNQRKTPLDLADKNMSSRVVKLLKLTQNLFDGAKQQNLTQVGNCIHEGAIVNANDANGNSSLRFALACKEIVKNLLEP